MVADLLRKPIYKQNDFPDRSLEPAPQGMGAPQAKENTPGYVLDLPGKPQGSTPDTFLSLLQGTCFRYYTGRYTPLRVRRREFRPHSLVNRSHLMTGFHS